MMSRMQSGFLTLLLLWCVAGDAPADDTTPTPTGETNKSALPSDPVKLLAFLQAEAKTVKTVQARFRQTKELKLFERTLVLEGRIALEQPMRMIWHVEKPVRYTMLMADGRLKQWDEDTDQVQTIKIDDEPAAKEVFRQFHAWLVGDFVAIRKAYDATVVSREPITLVFVPKPKTVIAEVVRQVQLTMGTDYRYVSRLRINETNGDVTTIQFTDTLLDKPVPTAMWEIPPQ